MHTIENWSAPAQIFPPEAGRLHLWRIDLDATGEKDPAHLLSEDELERARRFLSDEDRRRFVRARSAMRTILGQYLETAPEELAFVYGPQGKPFLVSPATVLAFNLSHSGGLALLAVSRETALGIDLERPRDRPNLPAIARRVFDAEVQQELARLDGAALTQAFFFFWTGLEARMKALGNGIFTTRQPTRDADLKIRHFIPEKGYMAAVAMEQNTPPPADWETWLFT